MASTKARLLKHDFPVHGLARLQNEVGTKYVFSRHELSHKKGSKNYPEMFEPLNCGSENTPQNFPPTFPTKNFRKITDKLLQERREKGWCRRGRSEIPFFAVFLQFSPWAKTEGQLTATALEMCKKNTR